MAKVSIFLSIYGTGDSAVRDLPFEVSSDETVLSLLERLDALGMLPKRFGEEPGYLDLLVFVNHKNVAVGPGYGRKLLAEGDRVIILQAAAGG